VVQQHSAASKHPQHSNGQKFCIEAVVTAFLAHPRPHLLPPQTGCCRFELIKGQDRRVATGWRVMCVAD
jgi:hypothetical protein